MGVEEALLIFLLFEVEAEAARGIARVLHSSDVYLQNKPPKQQMRMRRRKSFSTSLSPCFCFTF